MCSISCRRITLGLHSKHKMGIGERQPEAEIMTQEEEGCLNPLTKTKDPESAANNHKQGIWQKLRSAKVPLVPVLVGAAIASILVIVLSVLSGREKIAQTEKVENVLTVQCPDDWILYNGKCYYVSDEHYTWSESQKFCESHNSSLAVIDNVKELEFLKRLKDNFNHWIGLSKTDSNSGWVWTNGTPYTENLFSIVQQGTLNPGEPVYVFLNDKDVKSGRETPVKKWFCNYRLSGHPP